MSAPEDEYEVEVGRPVMPGTELRPFVSLEPYAPPLQSTLTTAEVAASRATVATAAQERVMAGPLIPAKYVPQAVAVAAVLAGAAAFAPKLTFVPPWALFALWGLAAVSALLAGVPLPGWGGVAFNPKLAPVLLSVTVVLESAASQLPAGGTWQAVVAFLGVLCAAAAGKAMPAPQDSSLKAA